MEKIIPYITVLSVIIGIGISIGLFQGRMNENEKSITGLLIVTASLDVIELRLTNLDKRLNRIEYNSNDLAYNNKENIIPFVEK